MEIQYIPYLNDFVEYESAPNPSPKLNLPLFDQPIPLDWADHISEDGTIFVKDTLPKATRSQYTGTMPSLENLTNLSFEELIKQENLPVKITSSLRKGAKTKSGHVSYHSLTDEHGHSKAYDIVPINGDFEELRKLIINNPRVMAWLGQKGYGIFDETSPKVMAKTGATGKHFHIGPDKVAKKSLQEMIAKGLEGMKIRPFIEYLSAEIPEVEVPIISKDYNDYYIPTQTFQLSETSSDMPMATRSEVDIPVVEEVSTEIKTTPQKNISDKFGLSSKLLLSSTIDKLSKQDPNIGKIRQFLLNSAALESGYKLNSASKKSTASGWFGFIDSTKKNILSKMGIYATREQFNNDPELLVKAAARLYSDLLNFANKNGLLEAGKQKGYSLDDIIHACWLNPTWAKNYFLRGDKGGKDAFGTDIEKYLKKIHS